MKIRNVSGFDRMIAATGQHVADRDTVEVPDELGASLCEQPANWEAVASPSKTTRKPAETGEEGDD